MGRTLRKIRAGKTRSDLSGHHRAGGGRVISTRSGASKAGAAEHKRDAQAHRHGKKTPRKSGGQGAEQAGANSAKIKPGEKRPNAVREAGETLPSAIPDGVLTKQEMKSRFSLELELKIRQCARHDLPQLEWFGLYTEHRQLIEEAFRRQQTGEVMMLVADLDDFPVGQAWLDLSARETDSVGVIWALRVFPLLRNHGIGSRLMIAAEQLLFERGYRWSELTVDQQEPRARRLYERLGYRSAGATEGLLSYTTPEKKFVALNLQLWIFRKRLHPRAMKWEVSQTSRE